MYKWGNYKRATKGHEVKLYSEEETEKELTVHISVYKTGVFIFRYDKKNTRENDVCKFYWLQCQTVIPKIWDITSSYGQARVWKGKCSLFRRPYLSLSVWTEKKYTFWHFQFPHVQMKRFPGCWSCSTSRTKRCSFHTWVLLHQRNTEHKGVHQIHLTYKTVNQWLHSHTYYFYY